MAFSLLDHVQQNKQVQLNLLLAEIAPEKRKELLAFILGRLVKLDRQLPEQTYQAIQAIDPIFFWTNLDQQLTLCATSQQMMLTENSIQQALEKLFVLTISEIKQLDEAANLEQEGVSELLQGQVEHLQGQAPDWLWDLIQLDELKGQTTEAEAPVDLNKSIADLSSMIQEANKSATPALPQAKLNPYVIIAIIIMLITAICLAAF